MIDINKMYKNDFAKSLLNDMVEYAKKLAESDELHEESIEQKYIHVVSEAISEVSGLMDNLNHAEVFLNSYSVSKLWVKHYDKNHYIRYHYEAWVINAIRLYERLLILINDVYELGINHKDVTYTSVSQHPGLSSTRTLEVLNKVHGALSSLQGLKNSIFHRYLYSDQDLTDIARYDLVARHSEGKERRDFEHASKYLSSKYLSSKKAEIKENNNQLALAVDAILSTLDERYSAAKRVKAT